MQLRIETDDSGKTTYWFDGEPGSSFTKRDFAPGSMTHALMNTIESSLDELLAIWNSTS